MSKFVVMQAPVFNKRKMELFTNHTPSKDKKITSEACIHYLWLSNEDYKDYSIKWNPAVKTANDHSKIWESLLDERIDFITANQAPHSVDEKSLPHLKPNGQRVEFER
jgi:dihydroorotase